MKYNKIIIKDITKFIIGDTEKKLNYNNFSNIFWSNLFDKKLLKEFLFNKYIPTKKNINKSYINEILFFYENINNIKNSIDAKKVKNIKSSDLFLAFIAFEKIISYYNEYYNDSGVKISLLKGLSFNKLNTNIEKSYNEIIKNGENFINDLIKPILDNFLINQNRKKNNIYLFEIFWPEEIINILIFGNIIKSYDENNIIVLDLGKANEQYDFTKWDIFFKENIDFFSKYIDYIIPNKDFGNSFNNLYLKLNGNIDVNLVNLISLINGQYISYELDNIKNNEIQNFIKSFYKNNFYKIFGKIGYYSRMFPYKCYWSKCNFCTINSGNNIKFSSKYSYEYFIDLWIEFIKKNNIQMIVFGDEAISPIHIEKFAKKIIENKLKIIYQFRTKFDKRYTKKLCKLLYKSGARYCGIGLESASYRINEEIGNKGEKDITNKDKLEIIHNFDQSGISFHNYAIMGFPTETKIESIATYNFLIKNIENSNYYTSTPNIFGLMKGSEIFNNPQKYNIKIDKNTLNNPLNLNYEFNYINGEKRDLELYKKLAEKIHQKQFTPWLIGKDFNNAKGFWDFIDRSSYFYKMKMLNKKNPYIEYKNINNNILKEDINIILNNKYDLSKGLNFKIINEKLYLFDYINIIEIILDKKYYNFLGNYKSNKKLIENINDNNIYKIDNELIIQLIENRLLIIKKGMK